MVIPPEIALRLELAYQTDGEKRPRQSREHPRRDENPWAFVVVVHLEKSVTSRVEGEKALGNE